MTKQELVNRIFDETGIEKAAVMVVVEEFMSTIKSNMAEGENVYLGNFGTFEVVKKAEKTARNITKWIHYYRACP